MSKAVMTRLATTTTASDLFDGIEELWNWIFFHSDDSMPNKSECVYVDYEMMWAAVDEAEGYFDSDTEDEDEQAAMEQIPELRDRLKSLPTGTIICLRYLTGHRNDK